MRLGKIEKAIVTEIGNGDWDFKKEKSELRRDVGLDPDELFNAVKEGIDPRVPDEAITKHLKKFQPSYSRALNNLVRKDLISRHWVIVLDLGLTPEQRKTVVIDPMNFEDGRKLELFVTDQFRNTDPEFDIPRFNIVDRKCFYTLTDKGREIKEQRNLFKQY